MSKNVDTILDDMPSDDIEIVVDGELPAEKEDSIEEHHHHHHHRSRHRHRHSKRRKSKNKKDSKKVILFLKKNRGLLVNIFACTLVIILLIIIAVGRDKHDEAEGTSGEVSTVYESAIRIEIPLFSEDVRLVKNPVEEYIQSENRVTAHELWRDNKGDVIRLDNGIPFEFTYKVLGKPEGVSVESSTLEIATNRSYIDAQVYDVNGENAINIYNLKTGLQYYYRLNLTLSDGSEVGAVGSFKTADTTRLLNIDGISNVRDIGGWTTVDGKKIKQGLLYRGSELDGLVEPNYCLTEYGIYEMLFDLGISFDMDLRSSADNPNAIDALGDGVEHTHYGAPAYSDILLEENNEIVRRIFSDLADKSNYPVYMHCTYGRDRTGTVCYLLEALLGVSDADLKKEYELSAFADGFADLEKFAAFTTHIEYLEGDTTQEKVEGYLLSVGVTAEEIASIREIFLGE